MIITYIILIVSDRTATVHFISIQRYVSFLLDSMQIYRVSDCCSGSQDCDPHELDPCTKGEASE
jgi:hypothetical protein